LLNAEAAGDLKPGLAAVTCRCRCGGGRAYHRPVSLAVSLEELEGRLADFGKVAFLVTTGGEGAHVVSVAVAFDGERFSMSAGRSSRANVDAKASATLLWPSPDDGPYCLIVDGEARVHDDDVLVDPTRAVLHRLADAPADLPSCVPLESSG
jgi:hypothetical protein